MAMPRRDHRDSRVAVQKAVAVHVLDHRSLAPGDHQRVAASIGWRENCSITLDDRVRLGTGQGCRQMRKVRTDFGQSIHKTTPSWKGGWGRGPMKRRLVGAE